MPLAAAGHDVVAVDFDAAMLDRARAAWGRATGRGDPAQPSSRGGTLTIIEHDLTTLDIPTRFGLAILAFNSLLLLDGRAAQERALNVMRAHLTPGGRAVIDVWLPTADDLSLYDGRETLDWVRTDTESSTRVAKTTQATYDQTTRTAHVVTTFDEAREGAPEVMTTREDRICFVGADELVALAAGAGLELVTLAGDYAMTRLSDASERVVLIARVARA